MARIVFALILLFSLPATAQDATEAAAARALFSEGVVAADANDWTVAAQRFEQALRLRPSPTIALNLAIALGHLGRVVESAELLRGAIRDASASETVRASAQHALMEIEPQIAWAELTVEGSLEGINLEADGHALSNSLVGTAVPLDPGSHHLVALRSGVAIAEQHVELSAGTRGAVHLVIPAPPPVIASEDPVEPVVIEPPLEVPSLNPGPEVPSTGPDPWALGLGIGGGVLVVGGVLTLVLVFALPSEATPFLGNAGVIEVGR